MPTTGAEVAAPAGLAWRVLVDVERWGLWGPTVRGGELDGPFETGTHGRVQVLGGMWLPFVLTDVVVGHRWGWRVAGVPATTHLVDELGPERCRVAFGVPLLAAPYLAVCRVGARRLARLVEADAAAR